MKEYYVLYTLAPQYNREWTESNFFFPYVSLKLKLKIIIFQIIENLQPI